MDCPECGKPMSDGIAKFRLKHRFGKAPNTLRNKTKVSHIWRCGSCNKCFRPCLIMTEVELVE